MPTKRRLADVEVLPEQLRYVTPAQADFLLRGHRAARCPHAEQVVVDLLKHMDGRPIEFIIGTLKDAQKMLKAVKAENDDEEDAPLRLEQGMRGQFSLSDVIAADLMGPRIAELAGLLPPPMVGDGPAMGRAIGLKRGVPPPGCPVCSVE